MVVWRFFYTFTNNLLLVLMKKYLLIALALICSLVTYAQNSTQPQSVNSEPVKQWTSSFKTLDVDAPIKLTLTQIPADQAPYIIYDTKGVTTSKFTAEVDRDGTLKIRERYDSKRIGQTEVQVFYNSLDDIKISRADAQLLSTLTSTIIDIVISNNAQFTADIDVKDIKIRISGDCRVEITGYATYQDADVATAKYNAAGLLTQSTIVRAEHNAEVKVDATQRLEAKSTTGGKIYYRTEPEIIRIEKSLFGVDVTQLK